MSVSDRSCLSLSPENAFNQRELFYLRYCTFLGPTHIQVFHIAPHCSTLFCMAVQQPYPFVSGSTTLEGIQAPQLAVGSAQALLLLYQSSTPPLLDATSPHSVTDADLKGILWQIFCIKTPIQTVYFLENMLENRNLPWHSMKLVWYQVKVTFSCVSPNSYSKLPKN